MPTLYKLLQSAITPQKRNHCKRNKRAALITSISKLLFIRNQNMNGIAKINTLRLRLSGVPKRNINALNKTYDCVSYKLCTHLLDSYSSNTQAPASEWTGLEMCHVGDNVDLHANTRHESSGNSSKDFHFYNNLMVKNRVDCATSSDIPPELPDVFSIDQLNTLIPNACDVDQLVVDLKPLVASAWAEYDKAYVDISKRSPHSYTIPMSQKSEVVSRRDFYLMSS